METNVKELSQSELQVLFGSGLGKQWLEGQLKLHYANQSSYDPDSNKMYFNMGKRHVFQTLLNKMKQD